MEDSYKKKRYQKEVDFRMSCNEVFNQIQQRFKSFQHYSEEADEIVKKVEDLHRAWSDLIVKLLVDYQVEEGIINHYSPLNRFPEAFENYQKKIEERLRALEGK